MDDLQSRLSLIRYYAAGGNRKSKKAYSLDGTRGRANMRSLSNRNFSQIHVK